MNFLTDIISRQGKTSSKKFWFNVACFTATAVLIWVTYKDSMEDWAYIIFYLSYLLTVGGFEIILKMMTMIIDFKNGKGTVITTTVEEVKQ